MTLNIKQALQWGIDQLSTAPIAYADNRSDCEILLQETLHFSRAYLYAHNEHILTLEQWQLYQCYIQQRQLGQPIAYLIGRRDFWTLSLIVNPDTLIPRHETELLVSLALTHLEPDAPLRILDLGTGSGAIALALARERPHWHITACDQSESALQVARHNAKQLSLMFIEWVCSDWFSTLEDRQFHAIITNPPYLAEHDPHLTQGDLRYEPREALVSGQDGLEDLHSIIQQSRHHLYDQGLLLLEHGYNQGPDIANLLTQYGYKNIRCWQDPLGHDRISGANIQSS